MSLKQSILEKESCSPRMWLEEGTVLGMDECRKGELGGCGLKSEYPGMAEILPKLRIV